MDVPRTLGGHDIFRSLTVEEVNQVSSFAAMRKLQKDELVFEIDSRSTHVYMLIKGGINLRLPAKDQDFNLVISQVKAGELFGLSPLLGSTKYTTTAQCTAPTEVLSIEAKPFEALLKGNLHVGQEVMRQVANIYITRYIELLMRLSGVMSQVASAR